MPPTTTNRSWPTVIRSGIGRIANLAQACTEPDIAHLPMIPVVAEADAAADLPTGVFSDIQANSPGSDVERGLDVLRIGGHDGVTPFGGEGSRCLGGCGANETHAFGHGGPLSISLTWRLRSQPDRAGPLLPVTRDTGDLTRAESTRRSETPTVSTDRASIHMIQRSARPRPASRLEPQTAAVSGGHRLPPNGPQPPAPRFTPDHPRPSATYRRSGSLSERDRRPRERNRIPR